ncbi:hypothetical protein BDB01DRAFT_236285 [Pilobolus umbonatus]|nr:hypothetical protein BDB01DRAFT_236285 [Pilobolus umbonatus]
MNMPTSNTTTEKKSTEEELVPSGSLLKHIDPKSSSPQVKKVSSASYRERIIKRKKSVELEEGETVTPSPSPPREVNLDTEEVKIPHPTPPTVNVLATSKNADTEQEQLVYTRLLKRLATAYKTRAGKSSSINSLVDHMFAFCNYVISYYYMDRLHANTPFTEAIKGWRSLFPYVETFMKQIQEKKEHTLYGLCCCLMSLIRFYLFRRLEKLTKPDLAAYSNDQESATQAKDLITRSDELLKEYEKGHYLFSNSEKFFNIGVLAKAFPKSFESIVVQGDLSLGVTLNGEAGVKTAPMYPFSPFSSLRHAAIAIKVILVEFIESRNLEFKLLKDPEDYL